jgi:hypothetical protein
LATRYSGLIIDGQSNRFHSGHKNGCGPRIQLSAARCGTIHGRSAQFPGPGSGWEWKGPAHSRGRKRAGLFVKSTRPQRAMYLVRKHEIKDDDSTPGLNPLYLHACHSEPRARNSLSNCHSAKARGEESMHFGPICRCHLCSNRRSKARLKPSYAFLFAYRP